MTSPSTLNVLFVDDDTDESYLFNEALEQSGFPINLTRAHDGNELLRVLQAGPLPDLILMDINMPYKDGIEALEEIRSINKFSNVYVVIYSLTGDKSSIQKAYEKGADLYLIKPDDFEGMLSAVKKIYSIDWQTFTRPSQENFVLNLNN
jgi:CheY-like chemotaxis protein